MEVLLREKSFFNRLGMVIILIMTTNIAKCASPAVVLHQKLYVPGRDDDGGTAGTLVFVGSRCLFLRAAIGVVLAGCPR